MKYIVFINMLSFLLYGFDKLLAKKKKFRISEKLLFLISFMGGPYGAILGSNIFKHKTKKFKFNILNKSMTIIWFIYFLWLIFDKM